MVIIGLWLVFVKLNFNMYKLIRSLVYPGINHIDEDRIEYIGFSSLDVYGRVFKYKDEIYRGIYPDKIDNVVRLVNSDMFKELVSKGYVVETSISDLRSKSYPLILKHKRLTQSTQFEWTFSLIKRATIRILDINYICNKHGYELSDAHLYNVLFDGVKPVWIDIGSFSKTYTGGWMAKEEFMNLTVVPMVLMAKGELMAGYLWLQAEKDYKIIPNDFKNSLMYKYVDKCINEVRNIDDLLVLKKWVDNLKSLSQNESYWSDYQTNDMELYKSIRAVKKSRFKRFNLILEQVRVFEKEINSVIDLAGNIGLMSMIISKYTKIGKIINLDYDYNSIEKSVRFLGRASSLFVESYVANFMLPMHPNIYRNFKSDLVLALAVTHHLFLTQGYKIDDVFLKIASFSKKYVFIEFMPMGLWGGDINSLPKIPSWYNEIWFEENFRKYFKLVKKTVVESHVVCGKRHPHRVLFIGKIRS